MSVESPHDPSVAPEELQKAWEAREMELPPDLQAGDQALRDRFILERKRYYAMVENLDQKVGRMREFLDERSLVRLRGRLNWPAGPDVLPSGLPAETPASRCDRRRQTGGDP
jgi:hypothetical protein